MRVVIIALAVLISASTAFHKIPLKNVHKKIITLEDIEKFRKDMEFRYNTKDFISVPLHGRGYVGPIEVGTPVKI